MGFFDWIFGGGETVNKSIDAVVNAGDKMFFTDEEKSDANAKWREWFLQYLEATKPQNVSRRFIAVAVTYLWVGVVLVALVTGLAGLTEQAEFAFKILNEVVTMPFSLILAFYFAKQITNAFGNKKDD